MTANTRDELISNIERLAHDKIITGREARNAKLALGDRTSRFPFFARFAKKKHNVGLFWFSSVVFLIVSLLPFALQLELVRSALEGFGFDKDALKISPLATISVQAAAVGWYLTAVATTQNRIKQHTFDSIIQTRYVSDQFSKQRRIFIEHFEGNDAAIAVGSQVHRAVFEDYLHSNDPKKFEAVEAMRFILNYYEYLAYAMKAGEMDEDTIYMLQRGNISYMYKKCRAYIDLERDQNPKVFVHLTDYMHHWDEI